MGIDGRQLGVVVAIRMSRGRVRRRCVVVVVHARVQRRPRRALVVEPECMPDLLTDHVLHLGRVVVLVARAAEVVVVVLDDALGYVRSGDPDLRQAQPARVAVVVTADLDPSGSRSAVLGPCTPGNDGRPHGVARRGLRPVG